jgi:hypothetical protein
MENVKLHTEVADNFSPTLRSTIVEKTKTGVYLQSGDYRRFVTYAALDIMIYGI